MTEASRALVMEGHGYLTSGLPLPLHTNLYVLLCVTINGGAVQSIPTHEMNPMTMQMAHWVPESFTVDAKLLSTSTITTWTGGRRGVHPGRTGRSLVLTISC